MTEKSDITVDEIFSAIQEVFESLPESPGWVWFDSEYPNDGFCGGPFPTAEEAQADAAPNYPIEDLNPENEGPGYGLVYLSEDFVSGAYTTIQAVLSALGVQLESSNQEMEN